MKWNNDKSVTITKYLIIIAQACLVGLSIFGYWFFDNYNRFNSLRILSKSIDKSKPLFIISVYLCIIIGFYILSSLSSLINNIDDDEVFTNENINILRYISWACFIIGIISLFSTIYYYAWFLLFIVAVFMGMLLRVIKNVFSKALEIKEENDYTV